MDGREAEGEAFFDGEEMAEIGSAEVGAGVAGAVRVGCFFVELVLLVFDLHGFVPRFCGGRGFFIFMDIQLSVTCFAGGDDAVEHIDAALDAEDDFFGFAESHEVAGF